MTRSTIVSTLTGNEHAYGTKLPDISPKVQTLSVNMASWRSQCSFPQIQMQFPQACLLGSVALISSIGRPLIRSRVPDGIPQRLKLF